MNRSISCMNGERVAAAVEFPVNFVLSNLSLSRDRHVEVDVAITGMQAYVGRKLTWNFQRNVAVAGLQPPARSQCRPLRGADFDMTVAGLELKFGKTSPGGDVSISRRSVQR